MKSTKDARVWSVDVYNGSGDVDGARTDRKWSTYVLFAHGAEDAATKARNRAEREMKRAKIADYSACVRRVEQIAVLDA